jgi:ABC-2 type transport system ATP-binding protein
MNIRIESLTKAYGEQKAIDSISFEVKTGEILGFLGPNGAGKTTTMKTIANFLEVEEGDIWFEDKSVKLHGDSLRKHIGYLPENNPLYLDMPVMEYLSFCAELQGLRGDLLNQRLIEMLKVCGLNAEKHKKIGELSKGYRQRVGLAQAMIHDPEVLILDEPTTGLDPNQIVEIRNLIKQLGKEKTVILSTHILPEVEATCDRILIINRGKIVANGTSEELKRQAQNSHYYKLKLVGEGLHSAVEKIKLIEGVAEVEISKSESEVFHVQSNPSVQFSKQLLDVCVANNWAIAELTPVSTSLEDIFRGLTV